MKLSDTAAWPAIIAAPVGLCALALSPAMLAFTHWPLRLITFALGLWSALRLFRGPRPMLVLSPLVALGILCPLFYAIVPALLVEFSGDKLIYFLPVFSHAAARAYLAGPAEMLVLQFAALCIVATGVIDVIAARHPAAARWRGAASAGNARPLAGAALVLAGLLWTVLLIRYHSPSVAAALAGGLGRQVADGIAPLLAAVTAVVFALAVGRGRTWFIVALACGVGSLAALLTTGAAKAGVLSLGGGILLYACATRPRLRALAGYALAFAAVFAVAIALLAEVRQGFLTAFAHTPDRLPIFLERMLVAKLAGRQTESAACLQRVVARSAAKDAGGPPFYFVTALVPRVLWPEKPSLSLGARYAFEYCGYMPENMPADGSHSLSITLIGQPLAVAGALGLAVAEIVLVAALGLASLAAARHAAPGGMTGAVVLAALTPWLVDFDQIFALYVANAVKMLLYMSPVLIAWALALRIGGGRLAASAS